jgi:putative transposase
MAFNKSKFNKSVLDELLKSCTTTDDIFGSEGVVKQLQKALVERMLEAEMQHHLGYEKHEQLKAAGNYRNGSSSKKVTTGNGTIDVEIPRDRLGNFEPQLIGKYQRRLPGFDDKVLSMYSRGMTTRDIQDHIEEIYQTQISAELISTITDEVLEDIDAWQSRPLNAVYPIMFLDALVFKIKDNGHVVNKALYLAVGINMDGDKEILGMWLSENEGAKFWLSVVTELKKWVKRLS